MKTTTKTTTTTTKTQIEKIVVDQTSSNVPSSAEKPTGDRSESGSKPVLMKRQEIRKHYYESSATLSEVVRKLNYAGIAVVWLFWASESSLILAEDNTWVLILLAFTTSLALDALQYAWKTIAWGILNWYYTRQRVQLDEAVNVPKGPINVMTLIFFWLKVVACGFGFGKLGLLFLGLLS